MASVDDKPLTQAFQCVQHHIHACYNHLLHLLRACPKHFSFLVMTMSKKLDAVLMCYRTSTFIL